MVCAACIIGVGIGIGGIFLYRILRKWLQQSSECLSIDANAEHTCNNTSTEEITGACYSSETVVCQSSLICMIILFDIYRLMSLKFMHLCFYLCDLYLYI